MATQGIYQRGHIWWVRYTGTDGKQVRESSKSHKQKDALDLLKLRQAAVLKGEQPEIVKIRSYTFRELADRYLEFCVNQKDYKNKRSIVQMLLKEFGNLPLKHFTIDLIERYQSKMLLAQLSETTANRKVAVIKHMFTKADDWQMVNESVCKVVHKVKLFKIDNARIRFLSETEVEDLLGECDHLRVLKNGKAEKNKRRHLKPIILFALNTGCRRSEILSLRWENVDLKHGFINVVKTKNGENRQIPINDTLRETLMDLVRRIDVPWVFYDPDTGNRFSEITHSFNSVCKRAGILDFHFHDLRHTFASHLVMKGVDLTTVSRLLGHKSLTMTLRYAHLAPNHLANAVNAINAIMSPISTKLAHQNEKRATLNA